MHDMKITRLVKELKKQWYKHKSWKNIDLEMKFKIYESYDEKSKSMSINKLCSYLKCFNLQRSSIQNIIKFWNLLDNPTSMEAWRKKFQKNYWDRYIDTSKEKKVNKLESNQKEYIIKLRQNNPNMWYKRFDNKLINPDNKREYDTLFDWNIISKRVFYDIINWANLDKRITKRKKIWLLRKMKLQWKLDSYIWKMKYVYSSFKSLHYWQLDIKYLYDIPNYVQLWLNNIYLYQITFRDYKSWLVITFYWNNRDKTRVSASLKIFKNLLEITWVDPKKVIIQMDWWAEFSNIKICWSKWRLIEYIEKNLWWYKIINKKEDNGHVEAFHRTIEEELFDSSEISWLKRIIKKKKDKGKIITKISEYLQNYNLYWYSSYLPRYKTFWKKSPLQIIKADFWDKINIDILKKYFLAYDIDCLFNMKKVSSFPLLLNSIIHYNEFIVENQEKICIIKGNKDPNWLLSSNFSPGQIWVGRYMRKSIS